MENVRGCAGVSQAETIRTNARSRFPTMKPLIVLCGLLLSFSVASEDLKDGNWFRRLDRTAQVTYLIGFLEGQDYAITLTPVIVCSRVVPFEKVSTCSDQGMEAAKKALDSGLDGVPAGQMVDGVREFFSDYRNRQISIAEAVKFVGRKIGGMSPADSERTLSILRRSSRSNQ